MIWMLALAAIAAAPPAAADDAPASLADLQQIYQQSCAAREYGAYDDVCNQLSEQIRQVELEADRKAHARRPKAPPPQPVAAPSPPQTPPAAPASNASKPPSS